MNLAPYRAVFEQLKVGTEATVPVDTGAILPPTIQRKDKNGNVKTVPNPNAGRGEIELGHERGFRRVAKERDVGLTVTHNHMPDGRTILTLKAGKKREFTPEAIRKRTESLELSRATKAGLSLEDYRKQVAERKAAEEAANLPTTPAPEVTPEAPAAAPKAPRKAS
jgi:hypothetical protein